MSKIKEALEDFHGTAYYERADVGRTRKTKSCDVCENTIPSGSHHLGFRFYGEDGDWPVFVVCDSCAETEKNSLYLIEQYENEEEDEEE